MRQQIDPSYNPPEHLTMGVISPLYCGVCNSGLVLIRPQGHTCLMCGHVLRDGIWTRAAERIVLETVLLLPDEPRIPQPKRPKRGRYEFEFICNVCQLPGTGTHDQKLHIGCKAEWKRQKEHERSSARAAERKIKRREEKKKRQA